MAGLGQILIPRIPATMWKLNLFLVASDKTGTCVNLFCGRNQMRREIHILLVDDQPAFSEFLKQSSDIWNEHFEVLLTHVKSAKEALDEIQSCRPTVILVDAHLPDMNSLQFIKEYSGGDSPVVLTSEEHSLSLEESALFHGAAAYIPKTQDPDEVEWLFARLAELSSDPSSVH